MTGLEVIQRWFGLAGPKLEAWLNAAAVAAPDAKPEIDKFLAELSQAQTAENLIAKVALIFNEAGQIGQGKFHGEQHPSDLS